MNYKETDSFFKNFVHKSVTESEINAYTEKVRRNLLSCNLDNCPVCNTQSAYFTHHEKRGRRFYTIADQILKVVLGLLARWKCPGCNTTFTDYPYFALPYKRYTLPTIISLSQTYVEHKAASYRKIVDCKPVEYAVPPPHKSSQHLSHTTIFRWITTLGASSETIRKVLELILQANPMSTICRDLAGLSIHSRKYIKKCRQTLLLQCRKLLHLEGLCFNIFGLSIFPKLATNSYFY